MKNTRVEKIGYWSALVGQLGWSKNSRSYFKNILCCSFPNVTPHNKFNPNWIRNTEVQRTMPLLIHSGGAYRGLLSNHHRQGSCPIKKLWQRAVVQSSARGMLSNREMLCSWCKNIHLCSFVHLLLKK